MRPMEMAVNLLRCRRQALGGKNWKPQYRVVGDMVELTGVELAIDASFRHRNGRAQGASIIQSVQRTSPNEKGRTIDVHDLVSISRRCTPTSPSLSSVHLLATGSDAFPWYGGGVAAKGGPRYTRGEEADAVRQLLLEWDDSFPLAPQLAEGIGAHLICLRSQLDGFCGTTVVHDQDSHTGKLFRSYFRSILECYDRSHIQKISRRTGVNAREGMENV
ncbi:unnamed protein product [Ascophyllum nodosum]